MVDHARIDRVEVLVRARSEGGVIEANTIHQDKYLLACQAPDEGRGSTTLGPLDRDANLTFQRLEHVGRGTLQQFPLVHDRAVDWVVQQAAQAATPGTEQRSTLG